MHSAYRIEQVLLVDVLHLKVMIKFTEKSININTWNDNLK